MQNCDKKCIKKPQPPYGCLMFRTGDIFCMWLQLSNCILWVAEAVGEPLESSIQLLPSRTKQRITCSEMDATDLSRLLFHLEANRYTISCSVNPISFNETSLSRLSALTGDDGAFNDEFQTGKHSTVHWFKEPPTPAHLFIGLCFTSEDTHLNSFTRVQ